MAVFQPTLPARGATSRLANLSDMLTISTHAPRTGSDFSRLQILQELYNFNPRSPHGERRLINGGDTKCKYISTHAPRTGSDVFAMNGPPLRTGFQPTLPARGATRTEYCPTCGKLFQPTLPARGATFDFVIHIRQNHHFNPRSPHGERLFVNCSISVLSDFNPRSPHGERLRKVTILSIRIIGFAQKVYHKTVLLRISLAENAVILPEKPRNPVRTSLQKAGGLRFARAIRAARPYSISSPSGA